MSCSTTNNIIADTDAKSIDQKNIKPTPNEDGIIPGTWKSCSVGDNLCFQKKLMKPIAKNFRYPTEARLNNYQGKVYVKFEWDEQGVLDKNSITIDRSSGYDVLDQAAKDVVVYIPNLDIPATKDGKPVRFSYTLPVRYKIK